MSKTACVGDLVMLVCEVWQVPIERALVLVLLGLGVWSREDSEQRRRKRETAEDAMICLDAVAHGESIEAAHCGCERCVAIRREARPLRWNAKGRGKP